MQNDFYGHHGGLSREELITVVGASTRCSVMVCFAADFLVGLAFLFGSQAGEARKRHSSRETLSSSQIAGARVAGYDENVALALRRYCLSGHHGRRSLRAPRGLRPYGNHGRASKTKAAASSRICAPPRIVAVEAHYPPIDAVRVELEAIAFRDGLKGK